MMPPLQGVTRHLLILNVLAYFATTLLWGEPTDTLHADGSYSIDWHRYWLASFYPSSEYFRPWQVATHMFMHGNLSHLLFNMFSLYMFGTMVEMVWGAKRFLFFYITCGLGAWLLHIGATAYEIQRAGEAGAQLANIPMLGASGAIFGVLAGYGLLFPNNVIQLLFPPIPMKAKYFVLIMAGIDLYSGISRSGTGVAHFAHVGGAVFGALLFFYWSKKGRNYGW